MTKINLLIVNDMLILLFSDNKKYSETFIFIFALFFETI